MSRFPYNHVCDIFAIAKANDATVDNAMNMFLNNVEDAYVENDPYFYHGADHLDYKELHDKYLVPMQEAAPTSWMSNITNEFRLEIINPNYKELTGLWVAGDTAGLQARVDEIVAEIDAKKAAEAEET